MATKANVFADDYRDLVTGVRRLRHYQGFVKWQLEQARNGVNRSLQAFTERGWKKENYFSFHALSILNVFYDGDYHLRSPGGGEVTKGEDILLLSEEMQRRFNGLIVASLFELSERYLKRVFSTFLYQLRKVLDLPKKKAFHKYFPHIIRSQGTQIYFKEFVNWSCQRNCDEAVKFFVKNLDWTPVVTRPWFNADFPDLIRAVEFCRHAIVHDGGRYSDDSLAKLAKIPQNIVDTCLYNSVLGNEVLILPPSDVVDRFFESLISYEWALYVLLSKKCNLDAHTEYFRKPDTALLK